MLPPKELRRVAWVGLRHYLHPKRERATCHKLVWGNKASLLPKEDEEHKWLVRDMG